jgi:hypothetical protein
VVGDRFSQRRFRGVVIKLDAFPRGSLWASERLREAMVTPVSGGKDHSTVEKWGNLLLASRYIGVPQFKVPAVRSLPSLVKIQNQVQPPIHLQPAVKVEVSMNAEPSATTEMAKRTSEIRIRPQGFNA